MNTSARKELWDRLRTAGLAAGDVPSGYSSPWYVRVMLGIAGWIGALFIFGFIGAGFQLVLRSAGPAALAALLCCGGAYAVFRLASNNDFANQFGLAAGLAGQALFAVAVFHGIDDKDPLGYLLFFCIEAVITIVMPNFIHRIFTTLAAVGAFFLGFALVGLQALVLPISAAACALVWRGEMRLARRADLWQPVGYGLALGVLLTATSSLLGEDMISSIYGGGGWLQKHGTATGTLLVAVVFLAVTVHIIRELKISASSIEGFAILFCALAAIGVSFPAHGLAAAFLILIMGFAGGNRIMFGLGLLALASFLSRYYYQMHETLLFKSLILGATGALLLVVRWGMRMLFPERGTEKNA